MRPESWEQVDRWWAELFGLPGSMLWSEGVNVGMHAGLGDYDGVFVAGREGSAHVSLPGWADATLVAALSAQDPATLLSPGFWSDLPETEDLLVLGPASHAYTDADPGDDGRAGTVLVEDLEELEAAVDPAEWAEAGLTQHVLRCFALHDEQGPVGVATLTAFRDVAADVGVLVRPDWRGRGVGRAVARAATSYAVRHHGIARWRARLDNPRSRGIAAALGFEDRCLQLAVRDPDPEELRT